MWYFYDNHIFALQCLPILGSKYLVWHSTVRHGGFSMSLFYTITKEKKFAKQRN